MIIWNSFLAGTFFVFFIQGIINNLSCFDIFLTGFIFSCSLTDAIIEYKRRKKWVNMNQK